MLPYRRKYAPLAVPLVPLVSKRMKMLRLLMPVVFLVSKLVAEPKLVLA